MNETTPVIEIKGLGYAYGRSEAVHELSLTVRPGRCYGLFGRNGAGKTTTMKCLLNLLRPRQGTVRVFGLDPSRHEVEVKRRLAYVPDSVAFYPWMTVRENARLPGFVSRALERRCRARPSRPFSAPAGPAHGRPFKGPAHPVGPGGRHLPRAGTIAVGRTDLRPGSHSPARVHRDGDWGVPGR